MNPGPIEEAGKAAGSAIDALKSTPVILALVIFNVLYMAGGFYTQVRQTEIYSTAAERWKSMTEMALNMCARQGFKLQSEESHPYELPPLPRPRPPEANSQ
jgi:hypothetical protein